MHYQYVIYFKQGTDRRGGLCSNRSQAEREGSEMFERFTRMAAAECFKPTRYEVIEVD